MKTVTFIKNGEKIVCRSKTQFLKEIHYLVPRDMFIDAAHLGRLITEWKSYKDGECVNLDSKES